MIFQTAPRSSSVLIVDSDDERRTASADAFARAGWQVADAESAPIALARALSSVPDVIVIHVRVVGMEPAELIRLLRHDPDTADVPTIVVAVDPGAPATERARASGASVVMDDATCAAIVTRAAELVTARSAIGARREPLARLRATAALPERAISGPPCPECGAGLTFSRAHTTHVGQRTEQWLHYRCRHGCGQFEYRQRTRKLRKIS